jgi:uncharacterized protein YciI
MAYFLVIARDGKDPETPARRKKTRPSHLENLKPMVARDEIVSGGGILSPANEMVGSAIFVQFPSRSELDAWLAREPYVVNKVWRDIEVIPIRMTVRDGKITP